MTTTKDKNINKQTKNNKKIVVKFNTSDWDPITGMLPVAAYE